MTRYLLDTNIVSDLIRHPQGAIANAIEKVGEATIFTSIVVAAELRFGAAKKGSARLSAQLRRSSTDSPSIRSNSQRTTHTGKCVRTLKQLAW